MHVPRGSQWRWLGVALALLVRGAAASVDVQVTSSAVTVDATEASTQDVVVALAGAMRAELHGRATRDGVGTFAIRAPNFEDALRQVLGGQSHAVRYAADGMPRRIDLLDAPAAAPRVPDMVPASMATGPELSAEAGSGHRVRVTRRLARALGADPPSFEDVLQAALSQPKAALRADALQAIMDGLGDEPGFAATVFEVVGRLDDESLAARMKDIAGDEALRVARRTARRTKYPLLRERMRAVRGRLAKN